jgi:hypothetical protein
MNHLESTKTVASIGTADTATDATFSHTIDTLGYDYASVDVVLEANAASTSAMAKTLRLQQSDVDAATSYANITAFVGGGTGGFTIPTTSLSNASNVVRFNVDMRGKRRYLRVQATPEASSVVCSVVRLGKGEVGPVSTAEVGVGVVVSG